VRAIVTGGNGFIGSHVVDLLHEQGVDVGIIDIEGPDGAWAGGRRAEQFRCDVATAEAEAIVADYRPALVFHLAAKASVSDSIADPVTDANTTMVGLIRMLEGARKVGAHKLIYSSSAAVYGDPTEGLPLTEERSLFPKSPYAVSKLAGELYLEVYAKLYGLGCSSLRYANVYGPRQGLTGEGGVVAIFGKGLVTGAPLKLNGDGEHTRDYIFVKDVARANWLAAQSTVNGRFNVSTGVQTSNLELISLLETVSGVKAEVQRLPDRPGDIRFSALSPAEAQRAFGFTAQMPLDVGLLQTLTWMRESGRFG